MFFQIPVLPDHVRTLKDPVSDGIRIVHALINVNDLPEHLPIDPDPRRPKPTSKVTRVLKTSLKSNNGKFHLLNRGITVCVEQYSYDNQKQVLSLSIPEDGQTYGIIDGGHTHFAIVEEVKRERKALSEESWETDENFRVYENQFVHIEVLEGVEDSLAEIAEARNFSVQLSNYTLANYRHDFDWLLDAIGKDDADAIIDFGDNKGRPVPILDVIQVLGATNPSKYPPEVTAKEVYTSAGKVLSDFIDSSDPAEFKSLAKVARQILELYDVIRSEFRDAYNRSGRRFRATSAAKAMHRRRGKQSHYWIGGRDLLTREIVPVVTDDPIDKGLAIPVVSAFRALLHKGADGYYYWLMEPIEFFRRHGDKLTVPVMLVSDEEARESWFVGRNPTIYTQLTSEVRRWYLEDMIAATVQQAAGK